ncbi:glycosyltransferase family 4 protein [Cellulomonas hominis]|uniref:glycosyltransferase family 4 protein n=1 Tax=Cellulomonas hominis TaxID=156981 RepID=UPI001443EA8A|nr:glycosyltransferase family 4 protein [Cellulomonas hominis]NKY09164.1 glycosyltransferase family 4 protein [Cellulomonas hominis]
MTGPDAARQGPATAAVTGPTRRELHVLTPGDHFSPRTGSAIPTVVDGLCRALPGGRTRPGVLVQAGTYSDRYDSAECLEYPPVPARRADRLLDAAAGRLGLGRPGARRVLAAALAGQQVWPDATVLAHNAVPLVATVGPRHRAVLYAHNQLLRTYTRAEAGRALGGAAAVCAVSGALADQLASRLPPVVADRIRVVPNGVDTQHFTPRADPGRGDRLRVVFVGRMIRDKGADVLVDAVARLDRPDLELVLVGSRNFDAAAAPSPFEQDLRERAGPLGDRVRTVPFTPRAEVAQLYRDADVVVVPSRWAEPFALTVMEGMASGVPVVASAVGGIPEVAGDAGILVPPGDPDSLAAALEALADDESLRLSAGARARRWAEAHDWYWARGRLDSVLHEVD